MGDEDQRLALVAQRPHDREQLVHFLRCEHRGRLVEDQEVGSTIEDLEDLDALLQAQGNVLDASPGLDGDGETLLELANALLDGPVVEDRTAALVAQDDVLGNGERRHQHEVLVDHPDAERDGVARTADPDVAPAIADRPGVGPIEAVEDVHERGLARAVLADEGVDLALVHDEVDSIERLEITKALADAVHLEERHALGADGGRPRGARTLRAWVDHACPSVS